MIDSGFNHNLIQYAKEFKYAPLQVISKHEGRKTIDPHSFFGSFLSISMEKDSSLEDNPFFSEMKKQSSSISPLKQMRQLRDDHSSFFGAFSNQGTTYAYGIPSLKYRIDPFDISFEAEYNKYLNQYSNYLCQSQPVHPHLLPSSLSPPLSKPKDIFAQLYFSSTLSDPIYHTNHLIKSQQQFSKQGDDFYSSNQLDETGFINCYKTIHYEQSLQQSFNNLFYSLNTPLDQKAFYHDLIYLIQGIPSNTFSASKAFPFAFEFNNRSSRLFATLPPLTRNFIDSFIQFGTKMQLIQYLLKNFLFNMSNTSNEGNIALPFVLKRFYMMVHDIMIQINEKIMHYKAQLSSNKMTLIALRNKVSSLSHFINILYSIFNLEYKDNAAYDSSLQSYFAFYINVNIYHQSHHLINSLFNFYYSFNTQTKTYFLIKSLLMNSLHSYLFFIIVLIFNNHLIDANNEYFILRDTKDRASIALDNTKIPLFLEEYKSVILNNSILLEMIKQNDEGYFSVCNYKADALIDYLDKLALVNYDTQMLGDFIRFKEGIFNKKLELMYVVNEKVVAAVELRKNEDRISRLNRIKLIKDSYRRMEEKERLRLEEVKAKKLKYLNDIQGQIRHKAQRMEFELKRIKNEQIEQREIEKEKKRIQEEIVQVLKEKYEKIRESTRMIELYGNEREQWRIKRHNNNSIRNDLFDAMHDRRGFDNIYPPIDESIFSVSNYHIQSPTFAKPVLIQSGNSNDNQLIDMIDINVSLIKEREDNSSMQIDNNNPASIKEEKAPIEQFNVNPIDLPNFFIKNIIYHDILLPIIDTALDIANAKYKSILQENKALSLQKYHFVSKNNKEVDLEVVELLSKIALLLQEKQSETETDPAKIEIPIQTIIQEFFYDVILKQYKVTNHCFVQMMKSKYNLLAYFDFFKEIFLCYSGDLILRYVETIFDFRTLSFSSSDSNYLSVHLLNEITQKFSNSLSEYVELSKGISFNRTSRMNLNFSISNIEMAFKLGFKCLAPISFIFTDRLIEVYDAVFKQLLKQFVYNQILAKTYSVLKNIKQEYADKEDELLFKKIAKTFNECYKTLNVIHAFLYHEIIDFSWRKMREKAALSADIYEIASLQYDCIRGIAEMLIEHPLMKRLSKLYHHCSRFYLKSIIADYFDFNTVKADAIFFGIIGKMRKSNELIINYVKEERVIGEFYDLKSYFN